MYERGFAIVLAFYTRQQLFEKGVNCVVHLFKVARFDLNELRAMGSCIVRKPIQLRPI